MRNAVVTTLNAFFFCVGGLVEDGMRQFDENGSGESERETKINQTNAESTRGMIIEKSKRVFIFLLLGVSAVPRRQER